MARRHCTMTCKARGLQRLSLERHFWGSINRSFIRTRIAQIVKWNNWIFPSDPLSFHSFSQVKSLRSWKMKTNKVGAKAAKMVVSVCIQQITLKQWPRKPKPHPQSQKRPNWKRMFVFQIKLNIDRISNSIDRIYPRIMGKICSFSNLCKNAYDDFNTI